MPNEPQSQISEDSFEPVSPQELTEPATENTTHSESVEVPPVEVEAPRDDFQVKSNDAPLSDSTIAEPVNESETEEKPSKNEEIQADEIHVESSETILATSPTDKVQESRQPESTPEELKAQISTNEPLPTSAEGPGEVKPKIEEVETEPLYIDNNSHKTENPKVSEPVQAETKIPQPSNYAETLSPHNAVPIIPQPPKKDMRELQAKEQKAIKNKIRKRLDSILNLFMKQKSITNDKVEKSLHVSDSTATRYLSKLEKEGKIKKKGRLGKWVSYFKI